MDKPQIMVHLEKNLNYTTFDVKWVPKSARLVVLGSFPNGTGNMQVLEMCRNELKEVSTTGFPQSIKCGTFNAASFETRQLAMGCFEGDINIVDLTAPSKLLYSARGHSGPINAIDGVGGLGVGKGAPEIVTGGTDGIVNVWDPRQKDRPVVRITPFKDSYHPDCWTVAAGGAHTPEDRLIAAGFDNGDIKMFDLRTNKELWFAQVPNGVCSIEFDRRDIKRNKLVATTLESKIYVWDLQTLDRDGMFAYTSSTAHNSTIWCARHLPQNRDIFITAGGAGSIILWKYCYPKNRTKMIKFGEVGVAGTLEQLQEQMITNTPVTQFDWCTDRLGLGAMVALDQTVRVIITTKLNLF